MMAQDIVWGQGLQEELLVEEEQELVLDVIVAFTMIVHTGK